ncbi:MAG TPA: aminodeoxychorismate synthase component I [Gemmatimonadales bacterium]|nr:aminodeoxychorismate synthase component I [Gemmatimonadales bacterium]
MPSLALPRGLSPLDATERFLDLPGVALLESPPGFARLGRRSLLSADPVGRGGPLRPPPPGHLRLGYLAYEFGRRFERLPAPAFDDLELPDLLWPTYDWWIEWDHHSGAVTLHAATDARLAWAAERAAGPRPKPRWLRPHDVRPTARPPQFAAPELGPGITSTFPAAGYREAVHRVVEYIRAGDIFQANLSQRFATRCDAHPWALYRALRANSPAPFSAYLQHDDHAVVSHSPERFLQLSADRWVETRPIKGTRPRGRTPAEDRALAAELLASAKDRAEHVMIVDLLRNDLSRVSTPGTVRCEELLALESYASVHHLVSTVTGRLEAGRDGAALIAATFPGGSITGAPKLRAMEIIAELEPTARGVYCGAIGAWTAADELDLSIAIRTAVVRDGTLTWSAGGGIVADSDPDAEYAETLDKARAIADAVARAHGRTGAQGSVR